MRELTFSRWLPLIGVAAALAACGDDKTRTVEEVEIVYVDRSSGCLACHRPVQEDGSELGIERAHPPIGQQGGGDRELSCVDCHGGDPDTRTQIEAHVAPSTGGLRFIRNLTVGELDDVDEDYLLFVNPGDLRVARRGCGAGSSAVDGEGCHQSTINAIKTNPMATFAGELAVARYRAGRQRTSSAIKAIRDVRDPDFRAGQDPETIGALDKMEEPRVTAAETEIGPYQDLYLTKACMRCHLWSFGDNKFPGDFRSSGCSACHMVYGDDGVSASADPTTPKDTPPHPLTHELVAAPPTNQCTHCHYRGGRIGISFQGYREGAGAGQTPPRPSTLGVALHGHDANYYLTDEDQTNTIDETPPDIHFERGMHCVDCHTIADVHGDGHIYTDSTAAVEIRCQDCHGTVEQEATFETRRGRTLSNLERDAEGKVWLTSKVTGDRHEVTQIKRSVEKAAPGSLLHRSMGQRDGFSHTDSLACDTCHSAWIPTCFGCHIEVDMREPQRSLISGRSTPGKIVGSRRWVETDVMILMLNTQNRVALSMPAERMFFTAINGDGETVIDRQVRTGPNGQVGHGQRAFAPHTVRKTTRFMQCDRCHPVKDTFENQDWVMQALGYGSDRFVEEDGAGNRWRQDQVQTEEGEPTVLVGHEAPEKSRPLTAEIVERMMGVEVIASGVTQ